MLENGTLYISEVRHEDANNYGCTAGSSAGLNRKEIQLIVQGKCEKKVFIMSISFLYP